MTADPNSFLAKLARHACADGLRSAFIDRDGSTFRYVLNYLRDGDCILPVGKQEQQELRKEAEFYQVTCKTECTNTWSYHLAACHLYAPFHHTPAMQ